MVDLNDPFICKCAVERRCNKRSYVFYSGHVFLHFLTRFIFSTFFYF